MDAGSIKLSNQPRSFQNGHCFFFVQNISKFEIQTIFTISKLKDRVRSCLGQLDLSAQSYEYIIRILYTYRYVLGTNIDISDKILIEPYFTHIRNQTCIRIDKLIQKSMWSFSVGQNKYIYGIIYLKVHVYWIVFDRLSDKRDITWNITLNFHLKLVL